jgi:6-phosphofructokinase 2
MTSIATLTLSPALDKSTSVEQVLPEHKLRCSEASYDPGGGGLNVSRAIRNLGGDSRALWTAGGPTGELLRQLIDDAGIRHEAIPVSGMTRENLAVYERSSGQQYRFNMPGAPMKGHEVERACARVAGLSPAPDYLVLSGSLPPEAGDDVYARIIDRAPADTRVVLDTSGPPLEHALERGVFLVKPNLRELEEAERRSFENERDVMDAMQRCVRAGRAEVVVVSIGAGGALLVTADQTEHIRSPTVPIRSKVGAGDSMVAGLTLSLARGLSTLDAARFGVAAGAAAVMTTGSQLCRREDTERLYAELREPAAA